MNEILKKELFVFLGPPTSGKTSLTQTFAKIVNGDILRGRDIVPGLVLAYEDTRSLIPDDHFVPALEGKLNIIGKESRQYYFLDNIPRTKTQAITLLQWVQLTESKLRTVVLNLSEEDVLCRYRNRQVCPTCDQSYHSQLKPSKVENRCDQDFTYLVRRVGDKEENMGRSYKNYKDMEERVLPILRDGGSTYFVSALGKVAETAVKIAENLNFTHSFPQ